MKVDEHSLVHIKTDCIIKFSIPKWYENILLDNFNVTNAGTTNHQVTITFMENCHAKGS